MPTSEAQKRARDKHDAENFIMLRIKPRKEIAEKLRAYVKERGESMTSFLTRAAFEQIERDKDS